MNAEERATNREIVTGKNLPESTINEVPEPPALPLNLVKPDPREGELVRIRQLTRQAPGLEAARCGYEVVNECLCAMKAAFDNVHHAPRLAPESVTPAHHTGLSGSMAAAEPGPLASEAHVLCRSLVAGPAGPGAP